MFRIRCVSDNWYFCHGRSQLAFATVTAIARAVHLRYTSEIEAGSLMALTINSERCEGECEERSV